MTLAALASLLFLVWHPQALLATLLLVVCLVAVAQHPDSYYTQWAHIGTDERLSLGKHVGQTEVGVDGVIETDSGGEGGYPEIAGRGIVNNSLDKHADLMCKYNEMVEAMRAADAKISETVGLVEQVFGVLSWRDPRVTALIAGSAGIGACLLLVFPLDEGWLEWLMSSALVFLLRPRFLRTQSHAPLTVMNLIRRIPTYEERIVSS